MTQTEHPSDNTHSPSDVDKEDILCPAYCRAEKIPSHSNEILSPQQ